MTRRRVSRFIHEGDYVAEVQVDLIYADHEWAPYLTLDDAQRLDDVRVALRRGDLAAASRLAQVFRLTPVTA